MLTAQPIGKVGIHNFAQIYLRIQNYIYLLVLSGLCIIFPALMGMWMFFIPRSPEFLLSKGDVEGARKSLKWFRGGGSVHVDDEIDQIKGMMEEREKIGSISFYALMTEARYTKPLGIVLVLMALQQFSGINYILGYSTDIMKVT